MIVPLFSRFLRASTLRARHLVSLAPVLAAVCLLDSAPEARASWIQGVTTNTVSSQYSSGSDRRLAAAVVNDSGFFGSYHTSYPKGAMWLNAATAGSTNASITFDLGSVQPVNKMEVWNYNEAGLTNRGAQTVNISVAGEDLVFTTNVLNQVLTPAPGTFSRSFAQFVDLGGVQARYVRIDILSNYGGSGVGLSKVRFINTNTPPTIALATKSYSGNSVTVKFSEPVLPSSATNASYYSIQSGATTATITSAVMDTYDNQVVLSTSLLDTNLVYTLTATNVQAASDSSYITNTTVTIAQQFVLWLKADAGVTADGNGFVSQWADQSGAGNNALQATNGSQPTLVSGAINGQPAINFVNSATGDNELDCPHTPSLVAVGDISFFVVLNPSSVVQYNSIISKCANPPVANFPAPFDYELSPTTGKARLLRGNDGSADTVTGNANAVAGQTLILELVIKGTNGVCYLNGYPNGSALLQEGIQDQGNPVRIGRRESNDIWMNGYIAEILLMRGSVSTNERVAIETYLGRKYGISTPYTGAPVITSQPSDVTNYVGGTATFSVGISATNGASPKSLQWYQTSNGPLTGQTNATLVLSNLTLGQNATSYYLIATNVDGVTNSITANLTVLPVTAPYFVVQPQPKTIYVHQSAQFTALALGSTQLSYQWTLNNSPIIGATSSALTVANAAVNNAGTYSVTVTNFLGTTSSTPVALTVLVPTNGTYLNAVLTANPLLYYNFSDINDTTNTFNFGSLGDAWNGSEQGTYTADPGPVPPSFPMFSADNLAFGNSTLVAGGVQFPPITLNNTVGGAHCTMAAWVYKDFGQTPFCGIIYARAAGNCGIGVNTVSGQDQLIYTWNGGQFGYNSGLFVPNSQWCFVAVVVSPSNAILYLQDGTGMHTATNTVAAAAVPVLSGYVGWDAFGPTRRWYGDIDSPMIFDRALTPAQINALYAGTPMLPSPSGTLTIKPSGSNLTITWPNGSGTLQRADNVTGSYQDMIGITSPYSFTPDQAGHFYRLRVQ